MKNKITAIDACLPQTQCTQCTYPRCFEYAQALAAGEAQINQCPPGGDTTIAKLAALLDVAPMPLNTAFGEHKAKHLAVIDESLCIGCVMCIKACPTDAIVGTAKRMHTVIERDCTGCELCLEPCPVDCISMVAQAPDPAADSAAARARQQTNAKLERESRRSAAKSSLAKLKALRQNNSSEQIKNDIAAALARVKNKHQ